MMARPAKRSQKWARTDIWKALLQLAKHIVCPCTNLLSAQEFVCRYPDGGVAFPVKSSDL
jgi:hypothetical protein